LVCFGYVQAFITEYSNKEDIRQQVKMRNEHQKPKRSNNKTRKRPTRHDHPTIPTKRRHARLPNHHKHTQRLWCIFRSKHHIPTSRPIREERTHPKRLEHELRAPTQSLHTNRTRQKRLELHRKLTNDDLQQNNPHSNRKTRSITTACYRKANSLIP
jgi:hypothetical protein